MATTPDLQEPLITAARAQAWHQTGDRLITLEDARTWLEQYGLVLFAPRASTLGAPAPSLVEATLGESKATTTLTEGETARTLVARMVGEGSALPLNLLGGPGDLPDFLISAQAFPFVFTLRGDKGWKRAPETSGAVKVTPLGLRVYELLSEKGSLTVSEIVSEVGREITESAVTRALGELWQILRVLPVLQQGEGDTKWELLTTRFLKAVKAGANAGQPTALSALVSLYLQQSLVASEEEIAAFLSPLTARSRVRDVIHGLSAGRQLAEGVVNGKTVLYVPEMLPDFAAFEPEPAQNDASETEEDLAVESADTVEEGADSETSGDAAPARERIRSFGSEGEGERTPANLRGKPFGRKPTDRKPFDRQSPARKPGGFRDQGGRPSRPGFGGPRPDRFGDREPGARRPFSPRSDNQTGDASENRPSFRRERSEGERPAFNRPWDEERGSRPPRGDRDAQGDRPFRNAGEGRPPRRFERSDRSEGGSAARPFARPPFRRDDRPARDQGGEGFRPRGPRPDRAGFDRGGSDRPQRPFRDRPAGDRSFRPRTEGGDRPFRPRQDAGDRPFARREGGGDRPFRPRPEGGDRPFRPREEGGDRPFRPRSESGDRPFQPRSGGGDRPFKPRPRTGDRPFRPREGREAGSDRPGGFSASERRGPSRSPFGGSDRPRGGSRSEGGQEAGPRRSEGRPSFGGRPGGFGGGRPSFGGRPQGSGAGGRGGFRPAGRPGGKPFGKPDRPPRKPRNEDEA